jgi:hypothetical protein
MKAEPDHFGCASEGGRIQPKHCGSLFEIGQKRVGAIEWFALLQGFLAGGFALGFLVGSHFAGSDFAGGDFEKGFAELDFGLALGVVVGFHGFLGVLTAILRPFCAGRTTRAKENP